MPKDLRRPIFALRALNIETALIGEQVQSKEAALVQIRIQWWRDAIDAVFRGKGSLVPKHPVVLALQRSIEGVPGIKKYNVKRILDAREADLLDPQPPLDLSGLESYAESTATQLLLLQLGAAGITNRDADHAVSHLVSQRETRRPGFDWSFLIDSLPAGEGDRHHDSAERHSPPCLKTEVLPPP